MTESVTHINIIIIIIHPEKLHASETATYQHTTHQVRVSQFPNCNKCIIITSCRLENNLCLRYNSNNSTAHISRYNFDWNILVSPLELQEDNRHLGRLTQKLVHQTHSCTDHQRMVLSVSAAGPVYYNIQRQHKQSNLPLTSDVKYLRFVVSQISPLLLHFI